jgi:hypothetical protein
MVEGALMWVGTELGGGERCFLTFDVELDYVGEWMELHVSVRESVNAEEA